MRFRYIFAGGILQSALLLAACGGQMTGTATAPPPLTTVAAPASAGAMASAAPASARPAASGMPIAPPAASGAARPTATPSTPVAPTISVGEPTTLVALKSRTVVAFPVTNTGTRPVTFTLRAPLKPGAKPTIVPQATATAMPPGATWTITLIAGDEVTPTNYDMLHPEVTGYIVMPQQADPDTAGRIQVGKPTYFVSAGGRGTSSVAVEVKNTGDTEVLFKLHILYTKGGVLTGIAQDNPQLRPGESRSLSLAVDGSAEGAEPQVQISNVGR